MHFEALLPLQLINTILSVLSLKDDEYQTSYDDQHVNEYGVQQEEAPEEEEEEVGGEEQQEEEEGDTAEGSQVFDTEEVSRSPPYNTVHSLLLRSDCIFCLLECAVGTRQRGFKRLTKDIYVVLFIIGHV